VLGINQLPGFVKQNQELDSIKANPLFWSNSSSLNAALIIKSLLNKKAPRYAV
jgi:hypothetical protein